MLRDDVSAPMSLDEFRLLRDLIYEYCGIYYQDDAKFILHRRLAARLPQLRLPDFTEYYAFLRYDPRKREELDEVIERITTNETYFFREDYQLDAFRLEILPEAAEARRRGKHLTVWSAGCSTGEEVYSIIMLILESGLFSGWDVRVFGNDISRRVLQVARKGLYGRTSFRQTDEKYVRRYFKEVEGRYQIRDEVKAMASFGMVNLMDESQLAIVGEVDVILCRNVLIYFDLASRKKAVTHFYRKLVKGGYLLLGHSESLLNLTTAFQIVHLEHDMVYRKPL
jgi:chemotaxis protein methyltransferase CheR